MPLNEHSSRTNFKKAISGVEYLIGSSITTPISSPSLKPAVDAFALIFSRLVPNLSVFIFCFAFVQVSFSQSHILYLGAIAHLGNGLKIENAAIGAPGVIEAAAVGLPHDRWGERPLLVVVLEPGKELNPNEVLDSIKPHVASWWLPNDVIAIEEIPHTGTGKIDKKVLREQFKDFNWPN